MRLRSSTTVPITMLPRAITAAGGSGTTLVVVCWNVLSTSEMVAVSEPVTE